MAAPDKLIRLAIASDEIEATIWRDALQQEGILPLVRSRSPLTPLGGGALFETFELMVLARDEKRARWIIGEAVLPGGPNLELEELPQEHATAD
jgi:hypothetical protein